eukprot:361691-Chlamydomonas_euryale.AAC.2
MPFGRALAPTLQARAAAESTPRSAAAGVVMLGGGPARGSGGRGRGRGAGACFECGQHGHIVSSCPHADIIAQAIATSKGTPKVLWAGATLVGPGV